MELDPPGLPWLRTKPLSDSTFSELRRRAIFECCKWDPQVEDVSTLAPFPIVLRPDAWSELASLAEELAQECVVAERELLARPRLQRRLGLHRPLLRALASTRPSNGPRVLRFDFHFTKEGWRISEVNSDVPGGFNEASGFTSLVAERFPECGATGDPAGAVAEAVASATRERAVVALVHATAFSDDRQVMTYLAKQLEARSCDVVLLAPDHLRWEDGRAFAACDFHQGPVDFVFRFFPGEWLPNLPRACGWKHFFRGARAPVMNPGSALLTQTKRFPLVWNDLGLDLRTWKRLLPETCGPEDVDVESGRWVLKPALGRVGDGVGIIGVTGSREWGIIAKEARRRHGSWVAQRRFEPVSLRVDDNNYYPCIGVYTVGGRAAGAYGRVATNPLIDHRAQDAAVLFDSRRVSVREELQEEACHGAITSV